MSLYSADLLRSGFFILLVAGVLWLFIKNKIAQNTAIILVGLFMVSDLFFVDKICFGTRFCKRERSKFLSSKHLQILRF
jgi:hypothetical protein